MKYSKQNEISLCAILRFGERYPREFSHRILTFTAIAKILKISHTKVRRICNLIQQDYESKVIISRLGTRSTRKAIAKNKLRKNQPSESQIQFLTDPTTLISWAGLSLQERVQRFHRKFPDSRISIYYLRKIYRKALIKKKKIMRHKIIAPDHQAKIRLEALEVQKVLKQHMDDGYKIIYLDEFCTTKNTMPTHDWTPKNQSFQIDYKLYHSKTVASIISISREVGVELVMNFPRSVNSEKYIKYLKAIRNKYPDKKIVLFADQLRVHWSKETKRAQAELNMTTIFNASYSPNYNPSEGAISVCKNWIKKARLRCVALNEAQNIDQIIKDSAKKVTKQACVNFIDKSNQLLFKLQ